MSDYVSQNNLQQYATESTAKYKTIFATKNEVGSPLVAATAAAMIDTTKIYVYVGSEAGYTNGHWYYYDGTAWADGGVYNSTAFETDTTLSIPGMAADAKAVGDEIASVETQAEDALKMSEFDVVFDDYVGYIINTAKQWASVEGFSVSNPIPVYEGLTLKYIHGKQNEYVMCIAFCDGTMDGDKYHITSGYIEEGYNIASEPIEITVPTGTKYVFISKYDAFETLDSLHLYMFPAEIPEQLYKIDNKTINTNNLANNSITSSKTDFIETVTGNNKINEATMVTVGKMYYKENAIGQEVPLLENQYTTNYGAFKIPVKNQSYITISLSTTPSFTQRIFAYYFLNSSEKSIEYSNEYIGYAEATYTFAIPENAEYLLFNIPNYANKGNANYMGTYGDTALPYEPYTEYHTYFGERYQIYEEVTPIKLIELPSSYELVIGDTFELFYKGVVNTLKIEEYYVQVLCNKGKGFMRKFVYQPQSGDTGSYTLTMKLYDKNHNLLDTGTTSLVVKAKGSSPATNKNILVVGDSLSVSGAIPSEFKRRLVGSSGTPVADGLTNITFVGSMTASGVNCEAYGGYAWSSYNTEHKINAFMWITTTHDKTEADDQHSVYLASNGTYWKLETIEADRIKIICTSITGSLPATSGTLTWYSGGTNHSDIVYTNAVQAAGNPFWDDTEQKVDFSSYAARLGISSIDFVYVLLGWNGTEDETALKSQVREFLDNVLDAFPSCKIVIAGIEYPAIDGLINNYGSTNEIYQPYAQVNRVFKFNKWYDEISKEASYSSNVNFINISGQLDSEYNMIGSQVAVNTRNSETVYMQTNGVHPATSGSYQISDAYYRDFHHKLQA